jgi:protein O-mannosyl-transferase
MVPVTPGNPEDAEVARLPSSLRRQSALLAGLLFLATAVVFLPSLRNDFVHYDDPAYVTENPEVQKGLSWAGLVYSLRSTAGCNWHPVTWWSHLLDCQLYGLKPWGHHLTSVLIHALSTALVFLFFRRLTGAVWRSFFVAALFGLHPLRVESVAWIAERKDVLSTCFGLLCMWAYVRYVEQSKFHSRKPTHSEGMSGAACQAPGTDPAAGNTHARSSLAACPSRYYTLGLLLFALGLMSKPMLVTWPLLMLLLDYWPLERFQSKAVSRLTTAAHLLVEKIPFLLLAAAASLVTFVVQRRTGAMEHVLPFMARLGNAVVSYCRYAGKLMWPSDLCLPYPHPTYWELESVLLCGLVLAGICFVVVALRHGRPWLVMGWLWFLVGLVPVIGLVQVGEQAMADRYTYVPAIGLLIMLVWGATEVARQHRLYPAVLGAVSLAAVAAFVALTREQIGVWKDTETLFRHAIAVSQDNETAHYNLGVWLGRKDRVDEAIVHLQEATRLKPDDFGPHNNLAVVLSKKGFLDAAIYEYQEAIRLKRAYPEAHSNLGFTLATKGLWDEGIRELREALRLRPDFVEAHSNLGFALAGKGLLDEAIEQYRQALRLKPDFAEAQNALGAVLGRNGRLDEAIEHFEQVVKLQPDYVEAQFNLGSALARKGMLDAAIDHYQAALKLNPSLAVIHYNLGTALGNKGLIEEAILHYQEALRLKPDYPEARNHLDAALKR